MSSHEGDPIGVRVMCLLEAWDKWQASDAEPDEYEAVVRTIEGLRADVATLIDERDPSRRLEGQGMNSFQPCNINAAAVQLCKDTEDSCVCAAYDKGVAAATARIIGIIEKKRNQLNMVGNRAGQPQYAVKVLDNLLAAIREDTND